jgi:diadenosine tetraphosphate (Ap4A) HIT family hydrolase
VAPHHQYRSGRLHPRVLLSRAKRHIAHITDLDGPEAVTFGPVIARCTNALKEATRCEVVYVYVFGDSIPHLHVHLAPHVAGGRPQRQPPSW